MWARIVAVTLLGGAAWFAWSAWRNYLLWRETVAFDPSGAELYELNYQIDGAAALALLAAALALGLWRRGKGD